MIRFSLIPAVLLVYLLSSCAGLSGQPNGYGTLSGKTLFVVQGHPGALSGHPAQNYKPPEPKAMPKQKIYLLRLDKEKGDQLFTAVSDEQGIYQIDLPAGEYLIEAASMHAIDLKRLSPQKANDPQTVMKVVFPAWQDWRRRLPDVKIEEGGSYTRNVATDILFVD